MDLAAFGALLHETNSLGVQWHNPRDVREVRITGLSKRQARSLKLQWWGSVWPGNGGGGWMRLDDAYNGRWVSVASKPLPDGDNAWTLRFPCLSPEEWETRPSPPLENEPTFRRTLKVRIISEEGPLPADAALAVYGNSRWAEAQFDVELRASQDGLQTGRIEVLNGRVLKVASLEPPREVEIEAARWTAHKLAGESSGLRLSLLYAQSQDPNSNDLTRVTVRLGTDPRATGFSFVPQDVISAGAVRLPDFGALITESFRGLTFANDPGPDRDHWRYPVRLRLTEQPEMTRQMALSAIPRLTPPPWVPLGVPSARQEVFISPGGDWSFWGLSIGNRFPGVYKAGRDSRRIPFRKEFDNHLADKFDTLIDTRAEPCFDGGDRENCRRYLEKEYFPLIHVEWQTDKIHFHERLLATTLTGGYGDDVGRRGDETVALLARLDVTNAGDEALPAFVSLRYSHNTPIELAPDGTIAIISPANATVTEGLTAARGQISMDRPAGGGAKGWSIEAGNDPKCSSILRWRDRLEPGQTRTIYFKAPYVDLLDADEVTRLRDIRFDTEAEHILEYWQARMNRGMRIEVPDPDLNHFYKANFWHHIITTDRDPVTGLYNQAVATVRYGVYANETVMIARSMDMRGEHEEAERFLEPMLRFQGCEALKGRFSTQEGVFHSAGEYTHGEYAMNHGFVLWGVAEHYLMTRDRAYLERVAPQLINGCDFLITERQATMADNASDRSRIYGLSPASSLEDVVEYKYWFATNAYFHLGMKRVAEALTDIGHPEAKRIAEAAEEYRRDIESAVRESTTRAAVVPLRSGRFIPYVPSRVYQWRHLTEGWIREALYPALHLATGEVVSPEDPLITWMLDELEDNIFFSWQSGYNVEDYQRTWFEHGGVTLQPCLLDTPPVYLARDEIQAALRSFWNTYALLIYPDVHCFAEWARRFGQGGGPLYKTADEARFVMWLRELLVREDGDRLWLARGTPRAWLAHGQEIHAERVPTRFGLVSLVIRSETDRGIIRASVTLPAGLLAPADAWLRLRHPAGQRPISVEIDGEQVSEDAIRGEDIRLDAAEGRSLEIRAQYGRRSP